jgi:hypothetical protein
MSVMPEPALATIAASPGRYASSTVRASKFPRVEYAFDLVESETIMPNRPRNIRLSIELVARALMLEGKKQP